MLASLLDGGLEKVQKLVFELFVPFRFDIFAI